MEGGVDVFGGGGVPDTAWVPDIFGFIPHPRHDCGKHCTCQPENNSIKLFAINQSGCVINVLETDNHEKLRGQAGESEVFRFGNQSTRRFQNVVFFPFSAAIIVAWVGTVFMIQETGHVQRTQQNLLREHPTRVALMGQSPAVLWAFGASLETGA